MSREGNLIKNTAIIMVGKICTQMISFFLLPIYTAILSTEEYGIVDLLNTLISLLLPLITLQIEQGLFRYLVDNRESREEKEKIITTTIITVLIQSAIYMLIFVIASPFINNMYKYFLATNVVASIFSSISLQISRGIGDNKSYAIGSFITALCTVIFNILLVVVFRFGAYGMLVASLLSNIVCVIYICISDKIFTYIKIHKFKSEILKKILKYSIPLVPNSLSWWVFNASDRLIVSGILGVGMNGILAAANKFSGVYITVYNIFNLSWTETAALHIDDVDRENFFNKTINIVLKLFVAIAFGIIAIMPFIFNIIINEKFNAAYNQIPILMIASIFNVWLGLLTVIYIAKKDTKTIAKTSVVSAAINVIVHIALIKFIGLYAASISTLVAYASVAIQRYIDINKKYFKININFKFVVVSVIIGTVLCLAYYLNNVILNIIVLMIVIVYSIISNYSSICFLKKFFVRKLKGGV